MRKVTLVTTINKAALKYLKRGRQFSNMKEFLAYYKLCSFFPRGFLQQIFEKLQASENVRGHTKNNLAKVWNGICDGHPNYVTVSSA